MTTITFKFIKYKISIKYTCEYSRYQTHKANPGYIIQISIRDLIRNINGKFIGLIFLLVAYFYQYLKTSFS